MTSHTAGDQLPRSHYFITVARGSAIRTITVRTGFLRLGIGLAALIGCWSVGSSLFIAFHDDLIASLMAREARVQYAYEDRIAVLRAQVDNAASRQLVSEHKLEGTMSDLAHRASLLELRAGIVSQLADMSGMPKPAAGHVASGAASDPWASIAPRDPALPSPAMSFAPDSKAMLPSADDKPRPEADAGRAAAPPTDGDVPIELRVTALSESLEHVDSGQYHALAAIEETARRRSDKLRNVLASAGLSVDRFGTSQDRKPATGGPFVPLPEAISDSPFGHAIETLQSEVDAETRLRQAMPQVPLASPLMGGLEVTSPFGPRPDPFMGRMAMHTGVDLREGTGTEVRATAPGRVTNAALAGGYGNMVELDHGHGLSTRYAHLSEILVSDGQQVRKGDIVGRVGATGRATGPHLHYETRIDGEPVDPIRFLRAGQMLAALDTAP